MLWRRFFFSTAIKKSSVKLAYTVHDVYSSSNKLPIVIMDALMGSKDNWKSIVNKLSENTKRKVIAIDTRNHGDSPIAEEMTYKLMAEDVKSLLLDLGYNKASLVGWSFGGSTMQLLALRDSLAVEKLVIIDISPVRIPPLTFFMPVILDYMEGFDFTGLKNLPDAVKKFDNYLAKKVNNAATRDYLTTSIVEKEPGTFGWKFDFPIVNQNFISHMANYMAAIEDDKISNTFDGPTLFIGGKFSHYIPAIDHEKIRKFFPNAKFEYIDGVGHFIPPNKPDELVKITTEFMNK